VRKIKELDYCKICKHFRISREGNPTCPYEEICGKEDKSYFDEISYGKYE